MTIKASYYAPEGSLSVAGDDIDLNEAITISRNAAGLILVNGGAVA